MFFIKLFYFLKGYVIIGVEGLFIERFINICLHRDIKLRHIEKKDAEHATVTISFSDFKKLRSIVKKSGVKVNILKKCGFPALFKRYRKRYVFLAGAVIFVLFFAISTRFVWTVEINGANHLQEALVSEVLKQEGLYTGALKSKMSPPRKIKEALMRNFKSVSWAWAYVEGCKVRIEIHEGIMPPEIVDKNLACDVVAVRDGLVERMTVKNGEARAVENSAVMAGDVLIAGTVAKTHEEGYKTVHARGEVFARTWHEKSGIYTLQNEYRIPTGNKKSCYTLDLFSKTFNIKSCHNPFSDYNISQRVYEAKLGKKYHLGISLTKTEYHEVEIISEPLAYESAVAFAEIDLEQKISEELLPKAILHDKKTTVENIDDKTIKVTLLMEFTEQIGTQKIID